MRGSADDLQSAAGSGAEVSASVTSVGAQVAWSAEPDKLQAGDLLGGRYQIEAAIGTGASGRVLRAFDRETRAVVAVKILKPDLANDATWLDRLSRELRVSRQIQHPHVCRVFDVGEADGYRFLTMELASGGTVAMELKMRAQLPSLKTRMADARSIIDGVAAFHSAGIIHRDIKPDNLLRMADGRLVVSDFGLATDPGVGPTTTIMVGTPSYMAPEVVMGERGSERSDVWALGVVLHEMLFGARPQWKTSGKGERRVLVAADSTGDVREAALAELCEDCLSDAPAARPASAVEALNRFDGAVSGRRARPNPARRRRTKTAFWAFVAVVSFGTLVTTKDRWWSRATASLGERFTLNIAGVRSTSILNPVGVAADWTRGSSTLAKFEGRVACFSLVDQERKLRVIWGAPARAEDVDVKTGARRPAPLLPSTFAEGCPQLSPDGRSVLFERSGGVGTYVNLGDAPDGSNAREIVKGTRPLWLPGGDEFAFDLDSRHAGVFSLPTGEMTVVGEGISGTRQLAEKAVDRSGRFIALRFFDDAAHSRIVVESLRTFDVQGSLVVPSSAMRLHFVGPEQKLMFTLYGIDKIAELVEADWRAGSLRRVGKTTGADIVALLQSGATAIVLTRKIRLDAWLDAVDGGSPRQLTFDGNSDGGALSASGNLLIQRFVGESGHRIVRRNPEGAETALTSGPLDISPSFFQDGDRWVYSRYNSQEIVQCALSTDACSRLHVDVNTPAWPTVNPAGDRLAYVTLLNAPRLHVLDLKTQKSRDLGPALNDCAPVWGDDGRLWALRSAEPESVWAEFDVVRGARTGQTATRKRDRDGDGDREAQPSGRRCQLPTRVRAAAPKAALRVFAQADEHAELLLRPGEFP